MLNSIAVTSLNNQIILSNKNTILVSSSSTILHIRHYFLLSIIVNDYIPLWNQHGFTINPKLCLFIDILGPLNALLNLYGFLLQLSSTFCYHIIWCRLLNLFNLALGFALPVEAVEGPTGITDAIARM